MNKLIPIAILSLFLTTSCKNQEEEKSIPSETETVNTKKPNDFIPKGYVLFQEIHGDLNKDKIDDCILIIKGTDKDKFVDVEDRGKLDRNRRGIIVLFKKKNGYQLATKNYDCFSSENEDSGVYFPPELDVYAEKGNLYIHYACGRYGYTTYTFRAKGSDFNLIGYDSSDNMGSIVQNFTSINFLTKRKLEKVNTNSNAEGENDIFESTWSDIKVEKPIKLSEVKDFDDIEVDE